MSPNVMGVVIGLVFILPTIYLFRKKNIERQMWPFFLITLPIYYLLFGLIVLDIEVMIKEMIYGIPFILSGMIVWRIKSVAGLRWIAFGWLIHGLYDYFHDIFFVNPGVFAWYPAFCACVDIVVGVYLLTQGPRMLKTQAY